MPFSNHDGFVGVLTAEREARLGAEPGAQRVRGLRVWLRGYVANRENLLAAQDAALRAGDRGGANLDVLACAIAYERYGTELMRHVDGEFALAIYDERAGRLFLSHDELGLMPLFYAANGARIAFATNLARLVDEIGVGALDEEHIADYFVRAEHFGGRTPYAAIARLLPGESLTWNRGELSRHVHWSLGACEPTPHSDVREDEERLRELLGDAVRTAMPETGTIACELSGGLDSSTIFNLARREAGARIEAVSYLYSRSRTSDERRWMDIVLRDAPAPWHAIDTDLSPPFSGFPRDRVGEPNVWVFNAALEDVYARTIGEAGASVVLTGEGGDSVLSGDRQAPFFLADRLRSGRFAELARETRAWTDDAYGKRSLRYVFGRYALGGSLAFARARALEWRSVGVPWIEPTYAKRIAAHARNRAPWLPASETVGNAYQLQRVMRSAYIVALHYHGRSSPAPFRNPMLARPLLRFMLSLPWTRRIAPGADRVLQRAAFRGIVPNETLDRRDKGGGSQPFFDGLDAGHAWRALLTDRPRIVERGYARLDAWRAAIDLARVGQTQEYMPLRGAIILEYWLQQLERHPMVGNAAVARAATIVAP